MVHSLVHNYFKHEGLLSLPTDNKKPAKLSIYAGFIANRRCCWLM